MDQYQYRITVNDQQHITDNYPGEQWERIAQVQEERGFNAKLERRLITDVSILPMLENAKGYLKLKGKVICPWEVLAELQ